MSAIVKEKIFDELRRYHVQVLPKRLATERMEEAKNQLGLIEDIIAMLLSLVNGKAIFADSTEELEAFRRKIQTTSSADEIEKKNKSLFIAKIDWLQQILVMAKEPNFELRKPRVKKTA